MAKALHSRNVAGEASVAANNEAASFRSILHLADWGAAPKRNHAARLVMSEPNHRNKFS